MRLHGDIIEYSTILDALNGAKDAGLIPEHVHLDKIKPHASRSRVRAFEVVLRAWQKLPGDKRRRPNSGYYGAAEDWAATRDEWGHFIARIFEKDHSAVFGPYNGRADFHAQTHGEYAI